MKMSKVSKLGTRTSQSGPQRELLRPFSKTVRMRESGRKMVVQEHQQSERRKVRFAVEMEMPPVNLVLIVRAPACFVVHESNRWPILILLSNGLRTIRTPKSLYRYARM